MELSSKNERCQTPPIFESVLPSRALPPGIEVQGKIGCQAEEEFCKTRARLTSEDEKEQTKKGQDEQEIEDNVSEQTSVGSGTRLSLLLAQVSPGHPFK